MGDRLTVGHAALDRRIGVRIPVSQPIKPLTTKGQWLFQFYCPVISLNIILSYSIFIL